MWCNQLPFIVVGAPLFSALIAGIFGLYRSIVATVVAGIGIGIGLYAAIHLFLEVRVVSTISYVFGGWPAPYGIEYVVDSLNALIILLIFIVASLAYIYSLQSVPLEIAHNKQSYYYTLFLLLITGLVGIAITGDAFNLYVLIEIAALSYYALLAIGGPRSVFPTLYYLLIGSVGACFYLLGVGYLFIKTGSLNMAQLSELLPLVFSSKGVLIGFIFINCGLFIKMALFPLHGWLPNVYSKTPISTCCLLAPLMTKVSVYVLIRFYLTVFSPEYVYDGLNIQSWMMWLATIAIISGSIYAMYHTNIRTTITYIIVAEIGYMFGGIWLGTHDGVLGAVYHIVADSLMTVLLFMIVGVITFYLPSMKHAHQLFRRLPYTAFCLFTVFASIIGIPPTSGFFSKVYLIKGALQIGQWPFIVALLVSSLAGVYIVFRLFEASFFSVASNSEPRINESPLVVVPMTIAATLIVGFGLTFHYWHGYIASFLPEGLL